MKTPFRYDFVGSFLRPQRLKDARKDLATMLSQTESSEDPLGILTLCGDLKVSSIRRQ